MPSVAPVIETNVSELKLTRRGKVRDVYAVDEDRLLIAATDRISAFDCILPTPIEEMPPVVQKHAAELRGRSMLVRRTEVFPVECVVRGYLSGSGWKDYQRTGQVCGHQ